MLGGGVEQVVGRLATTDAAVLDHSGLAALTRDVSRVESFLNAVKVSIARRADVDGHEILPVGGHGFSPGMAIGTSPGTVMRFPT